MFCKIQGLLNACSISLRVVTLGVDSSHHTQTNVSVIRGIVWGISVHSTRKGEVLFLSSVYI